MRQSRGTDLTVRLRKRRRTRPTRGRLTFRDLLPTQRDRVTSQGPGARIGGSSASSAAGGSSPQGDGHVINHVLV
jgi:hypothetical protein